MYKTLGFVLALMLTANPLAAVAQDKTIGGAAVPEGQLGAVEERCTELQHQQGTTGSQQPETSMDSTAEQKAEAAAGGAGTLDLSAITLEQCIAGGFTEQSVNTAN